MSVVMRVVVFYFLTLAVSSIALAEAVLFDSLIARVGPEAVTLNDITRFRNVEDVMVCARLRAKKQGRENLQKSLNRYIEEELLYFEARAKKLSTSGALASAIAAIRGKPDCRQDWHQLGELYGKAWETESRPREGEGMLVRELEKRLMVDSFLKKENIGDHGDWIREARLRFPVKLYLD